MKLSMRDTFAAYALSSIVAVTGNREGYDMLQKVVGKGGGLSWLSEKSYEVADAMMKARQQKRSHKQRKQTR